MSKPNSPAAPPRAPKHVCGHPPAALSRRGILTATESCPSDSRIRAGDLLWRYFGADLYRAFYS